MKKGVLKTALSQLQSQLEQALRAEALQRHNEALQRCKEFEVEAAKRLNAAAQKFAEAEQILQEYHLWEKPFHQTFLEAYGTPQNPSRLSVGGRDWNTLIIPKAFFLAQESCFRVETKVLDIFGRYHK